MILEFSLIILTILISYYLYTYRKNRNCFDRNGIKNVPGVPVFGNVFDSTFLRKHLVEEVDDVYKAFPGERYVGFVEGTKPLILIRDPELIKSIMVKNFDHFMNRKTLFPEEIAPLLGKSLVMMRGESWREMRTSLSPSFTCSKLRHLIPFIADVSTNIMEYLKGHQSEDIDVTDLMQRYTHDVIASTALGIQINSVRDRNNKLFNSAKETIRHTLKKGICFYMALQSSIAAKFMKFLNIGILPADGIALFRDIIASAIEYRKKYNIIRPDFIHSLMEVSKDNYSNSDTAFDQITNEGTVKPSNIHKEWTPDDIAAQAYLAFLAGFENTSANLTMCIHELAINPNVQERLYQEISSHQQLNGKLTYDDMIQLKYLDCVINETFRKWSSAMMFDRICTKPYLLPPPKEGGKPYQMKPGDLIYGSVNSIQMDPEHHPDPDVFNPDRFLDENKHKLKPFTFMPFGVGPRACLGQRLATLFQKLLLYHLVMNFKIVECAKTAKPMRLEANLLKIRAVGGTWVQFQARN